MIILRQKNYAVGFADGSGQSTQELFNMWKSAGGKEKTGMTASEYIHGKGWKPTDGKTKRQNGTVVQTHPGEGGVINRTNNLINRVSEQRAKQRKANQDFAKANPNAFKNVATRARTQGYNAGVQAGKSQVGILGGAKNTWNGMNNTQKGLAIGGAAAIATLGTAATVGAIRNRNKRKQAEKDLELERARNSRPRY
jgi:hypothetical protein